MQVQHSIFTYKLTITKLCRFNINLMISKQPDIIYIKIKFDPNQLKLIAEL